MNIRRRITGIFLAVVAVAAVIFLLPDRAFAAEEAELAHGCSLTVSCEDGETPLAGAEILIYRVAGADESGDLTATEAFAGYQVDFQCVNEDAWKTLASTLEGYILRDGITPTDSGITDEQGRLSFPAVDQSLEPGLYLVRSLRHKQDGLIYDAKPSMVLLAESDEVAVSLKYASQPEPSGPDEETVTRKVLKVWKDEGHKDQRPEEIEVQLLQDGEIRDTVALNAENDWRFTWEGLDAQSLWTVVEKAPDGYTVETAQEGITFVVTNTWEEPDEPQPTEPTNPTEPTKPTEPAKPTEPTAPAGSTPPSSSTPDQPKIPQTGQLWWPVPVLACAGFFFIAAGLIRRRRDSDEES